MPHTKTRAASALHALRDDIDPAVGRALADVVFPGADGVDLSVSEEDAVIAILLAARGTAGDGASWVRELAMARWLVNVAAPMVMPGARDIGAQSVDDIVASVHTLQMSSVNAALERTYPAPRTGIDLIFGSGIKGTAELISQFGLRQGNDLGVRFQRAAGRLVHLFMVYARPGDQDDVHRLRATFLSALLDAVQESRR